MSRMTIDGVQLTQAQAETVHRAILAFDAETRGACSTDPTSSGSTGCARPIVMPG